MNPVNPKPAGLVAEVRYPLAALLDELKSERSTGGFGMEKLDQHEIGRLFKARSTRRVKSKK